nr:hypothetical protein [Tanacetum cinerariifolium]
MLNHQDKYMMKAQHILRGRLLASFQDLEHEGGDTRSQGGIKDNESKIKIQDHWRANDHSNEFPRTRLQVPRKALLNDQPLGGDLMEMIRLSEKFLLFLKNNPFHLLHHFLHHHNHLKISLQHPRYNNYHHYYLSSSSRNYKVKKKGEVTGEKEQGKSVEAKKDDAVILKDDKEEDKEVADSVKDAEEAKVDEIPVATTATFTAAPVRDTAAPVRDTAAPSRRRKGVVIRDPEEELTTSTIIPAETKFKDKELHAELNKDINWDATIDHVKLKAKDDPAVKRYQAMKRKPQTEAQARKNMMMYLKNVASFKLDYFKGMSYDDICPIFEGKFNSNVDFLLKTKEQTKEEENRALQTINETPAEKAAKRKKLNKEVEDLKRHLQIVPNEDDDVYTEATSLDLEALWSLIKERFSTAKPKNFSDDFLLTTLGAMFEKPDAYAQI